MWSHRLYETLADPFNSEKGVIAMRLGPGKHLRGLKLMDGAVEPEKFDYFHEVGRP